MVTDDWLLRPGVGDQPPLREKVVSMYEELFQGREIPAEDDDEYWQEIFLLKVNTSFLSSVISSASEPELLHLASSISALFTRAIDTLHDRLPLRQGHAAQTMTILFEAVYKKFPNRSFDVLNVLTGMDNADTAFKTLIANMAFILLKEDSVEARRPVLALAKAIVTASDNLNQNSFNEYFMMNDFFDALIRTITDPLTRTLAFDASILLAFLCSYNKYESSNPYESRLRDVDDREVLQALEAVCSLACKDSRSKYMALAPDVQPPSAGLFGAIGYVGDVLFRKDSPSSPQLAGTLGCRQLVFVLLFYECVRNHRFVDTLAMTFASVMKFGAHSSHLAAGAGRLNRSQSDIFSWTRRSSSAGSYPQLLQGDSALVDILSFTSYLFQNSRDGRTMLYTRLCLMSLIRLVENPVLCRIVCDINMAVVIRLCRQRVPHLPPASDTARPVSLAILDVAITFLNHNLTKNLDVTAYTHCITVIHRLLTFIISSARVSQIDRPKSSKLTGVVAYHWAQVWHAILNVVRFVVQFREAFMMKDDLVAELWSQIVSVFNLFITYGDNFLPDSDGLDVLYYEIIRNAQELTALDGSVQRRRSSTNLSPTPFSPTSTRFQTPPYLQRTSSHTSQHRTSSDYANIATIISHFMPKIEERASNSGGISAFFGASSSDTDVADPSSPTTTTPTASAALTPKVVISIIRRQHDTLELKDMRDTLLPAGANVAATAENPWTGTALLPLHAEQSFFRAMLRAVSADVKEG
ncbi:uncharacterized protein EV422DRAFT_564027 [Fimicolochytrium jonesii]|uniref:uncharacterized protein n=1 Tax=Fimicolochytrium jonesii TaxID=1396493 RepID=UPI0022FDE152|nr:uncharacterized protein EV422DRAFT_564027 [Fimicolochytrium jonesii]KAI8826216.1 hypothetical protein EV422DRAFT_564027 [Fimicolochytrium jonesii]